MKLKKGITHYEGVKKYVGEIPDDVLKKMPKKTQEKLKKLEDKENVDKS